MPITRHQIRAGRALADWSGQQLADKVGVSGTTISAIETGRSHGSVEIFSGIFYALQAAGIEFTSDGGVRPKQSKITIFQGHDGFRAFFDTVYEVAKTEEHPDICLTNVNEAQYDLWLNQYEPIHANRMAMLENVKLRVLMKAKDEHMTSTAYCEYRWIPEEQFADVSLYIFGSKTAFIEFSTADVVVTVVDNRAVTDALRKMFDLSWSIASARPNG